MSRADIWIRETGGRNSVPTDRFVVASGTPPTIKAGEPAKQKLDSSGTPEQIILLVDADLTVGTDAGMAGIAAEDSTEVSGASGYCDVYVPLPDIKWEIAVLTASTADTQSEIDGLIGSLYIIDLTSSAFKMDVAGATTSSNAFLVVGGDPDRSTVWFRIRPDACSFGRATV